MRISNTYLLSYSLPMIKRSFECKQIFDILFIQSLGLFPTNLLEWFWREDFLHLTELLPIRIRLYNSWTVWKWWYEAVKILLFLMNCIFYDNISDFLPTDFCDWHNYWDLAQNILQVFNKITSKDLYRQFKFHFAANLYSMLPMSVLW